MPDRWFTPNKLGGLCEGCSQPMPAALAGETRHPTCELDWPALLVASKRALRGYTPPAPLPVPPELLELADIRPARADRYGTATSDPLGREGPGWKRGKNGLPVRVKESTLEP